MRIGSIFDGSFRTVRFDQTVFSFDGVTVTAFVLAFRIAGQMILNVVRVTVRRIRVVFFFRLVIDRLLSVNRSRIGQFSGWRRRIGGVFIDRAGCYVGVLFYRSGCYVGVLFYRSGCYVSVLFYRSGVREFRSGIGVFRFGVISRLGRLNVSRVRRRRYVSGRRYCQYGDGDAG